MDLITFIIWFQILFWRNAYHSREQQPLGQLDRHNLTEVLTMLDLERCWGECRVRQTDPLPESISQEGVAH